MFLLVPFSSAPVWTVGFGTAFLFIYLCERIPAFRSNKIYTWIGVTLIVGTGVVGMVCLAGIAWYLLKWLRLSA